MRNGERGNETYKRLISYIPHIPDISHISHIPHIPDISHISHISHISRSLHFSFLIPHIPYSSYSLFLTFLTVPIPPIPYSSHSHSLLLTPVAVRSLCRRADLSLATLRSPFNLGHASSLRRTVRGWRDKTKSRPRKSNSGVKIFHSIHLCSR
jgi:hypothetical protein